MFEMWLRKCIWLIYGWRAKARENVQASWKDRSEWTSVVTQGTWKCRFKGFRSRSTVDTFHHILLFVCVWIQKSSEICASIYPSSETQVPDCAYLRCSALLRMKKDAKWSWKPKKWMRLFTSSLFFEWVHMPVFRHLNENICIMGREAEGQENQIVELLHYELQSYPLHTVYALCLVMPHEKWGISMRSKILPNNLG